MVCSVYWYLLLSNSVRHYDCGCLGFRPLDVVLVLRALDVEAVADALDVAGDEHVGFHGMVLDAGKETAFGWSWNVAITIAKGGVRK